MKHFNKSIVLVSFLLGTSVSVTRAANYNANYDGVNGSSGTTYTADADQVSYDTNLDDNDFTKDGTYTSYTTVLDVGSDKLKASRTLDNSGSNEAGEERAFFKAVTGADLTSSDYSKIEIDDGATITLTQANGTTVNTLYDKVGASYTHTVDVMTGLSTLIVDPSYSGGYFMLKFGNGNDFDSHWIFQNNDPLNTFVWLSSISEKLNGGDNYSLLGLSHFSYEPCVGNDCGITTPIGGQVPVPAAIWLFGSALIGLMGVSRKQKTMVA